MTDFADFDPADIAYLPKETQDEFYRLLAPPVVVTLSDLVIRTKDKQLIPFVPNETQRLYLDILAKEYPGFDPVTGTGLRGAREDVLKARQQGMTTLWEALYFIDTINNPLTQTVLLAHDAESTQKLFEIVHRYYEGLPAEKKRPRKYSNRREIVFADIDSAIYVATAGSKSVGRGGTINNAHLSERAFWENGGEVETGLLQAVPSQGNITRETTANGFNDYYDERQREHAGDSTFRPRFFGWNLHSEYRLATSARGESSSIGAGRNAGIGTHSLQFVRTSEEQSLADNHRLSDEQLAWRRSKMKELGDKFPQEYPINEREAFLSTGTPVFDREALVRIETHIKGIEAVPLPRFRRSVGASLLNFSRLGREHAQGTLKVFEEPREDRICLVTDDPASGVNNAGDLDYCSASLWGFGQFTGLTQMAHLYGRWEPHEMAWLLYELFSWYSNTMLAPLSMNHGHAVISTLIHECGVNVNRGNGWGGLYCHNPSDISEKVSNTEPEQRLPGFPENRVTKRFMVDTAREYISEELIEVNSTITLNQLFRYVYLTAGEMGGENGTHDDAVSDLASACAVHRLRAQRAIALLQGQRRERTPMPPKTFIQQERQRR